MRVTSKGQVMIPIRVRKALGIKAGSEFEFELGEGGARLLSGGPERVDSISRMRGAGEGDMTTDQILALTRR